VSLADFDREQRLDEVLAGYLAAVKNGTPPSQQELLDQHPDLAPDLVSFFADRDHFARLATPLRHLVAKGEAPAVPHDLGDYALLEEIARGGMGVVYRARQKSLGRVVALKMLLAGPWAEAGDVQRFRAEAEAAASLDHPNIVPIYEVGSHDGHPFLSMRLIEGGSLARAIGLRGQGSGLSRVEQQEAARLLATVAQAVHHAHQRGILHRDLKPANVLLDTTGTPYVTDFGLAKRCTQDTTLTRTGTVVGTPAYMAPEQAAGARGAATVAADVYGLGAILYELLTGQPPFRGSSPLDTLKRVLEEEPARPRALNPRVHKDLETVCLKCLSKEPTKRYAGAAELAEELQRFLQGEPILARPVGPLARAWRWGRRRPLVSSLIAALFVTLTAGLGLTTWQWQRAERHARAVEHQRDRAEDNFRLAHGAVNDLLYFDQELARSPGQQPLRRTMLKVVRAYFRNFLERCGNDPALRVELADAHFNLGRISAVLGPRSEACAAYREALAVYRELHRSAPADVAVQRRLAHVLCNLAIVEDRGAKFALLKHAQERYTEFLAGHPHDRELRSGLGNTLNNLGTIHVRAGRLAEARRCLDRAVEIHEGLMRDDPKEASYPGQLAAAVGNLGTLAGRVGDHAEAVRCFRRVRELWEGLARTAPTDPERQAGFAAACHNLAIALRDVGQRQEAVPYLRQALDLRTRLADANPQVLRFQTDLGASHTSLGILHAQQGAHDDALACYRAARAIHERLVHLDPGSAVFRKDLAASHFNVGVAHGACQRRPDELRAFTKARKLQEELLKADPDNLDYRLDLARTLNNMGYNLWAIRRFDEARPVLQQAIAVLGVAVERAPRVPAYRSQLGMHCELLALVEGDTGHTRAAMSALLRRRALWPDNAAELYRTACAMALVIQRGSKGKESLTPAEQAERRDAAELVLKTLRQAVARGFRDAALLRREPVLQWVREGHDFQVLLAELEAQPRQPQPQP
jgi:tetratricopeptide (TPR) repeat protein